MEYCDKRETRSLKVETSSAIYEVVFGQIQIEITGKCNMFCQHCRAADEKGIDMPVKQIVKVLKFARKYSPSHKELVISGGEPLLHNDFFNLLPVIKEAGGESISLTTNGALLDISHLWLINSLDFKCFRLSISLDALKPEEHDEFRQKKGAFNAAIKAIDLAVNSGIANFSVSVRTTVRPHQISEMEAIAELVYQKGCDRINFSSVHPSGRALTRPDFWMTPKEKRRFIEEVYRLKNAFGRNLQITTNDPLKCLVRGYSNEMIEDELIFNGCVAGCVSFNVCVDGRMTPCALMNFPMMNISQMSVDEISDAYRRNSIVHNMLEMNLKGRCGACSKKYECGGCRARALGRSGDYLAEDPDCWL